MLLLFLFYLEDAIYEGDGPVVRRVAWIGFVRLVYLFRGAASAPFFWRVAMFGHYLENCKDEVVGCVG